MNISELIDAENITMGAIKTHKNPHMDNDGQKMDHWSIAFENKHRRRLVTWYSMGVGHKGAKPMCADVLDCLASDASGIENARNFEDWASEYGYDADSRKAEATYKVCRKAAAELEAFLGRDVYLSLLNDCERL